MPAERILIVRGDGIGDALMLAPLVAALRDAGHALGAVLSTRNAQVYAQDVLERVHVLERIPWPRHGSTRESFAQALAGARDARYDVALIASEEPEAYKFARETGVLRRVGFTNGWEKPFKGLWTRGQLTRALRRPASAGRVREHEVETLFAPLGAGLHESWRRRATWRASRRRVCRQRAAPRPRRRASIVEVRRAGPRRGRRSPRSCARSRTAVAR